MVADSNDAEHNESWPRGRTNHYWFDLNRDFLLAVNPESRGKLNWFQGGIQMLYWMFMKWEQIVIISLIMKASASVKPLMQENVVYTQFF